MHKLLLKHINLNEEIALEAPNRISLTYHELNETIVSLKNTFKKLSINPLDPVAIVLPNGPDLGTLFLATACFGIAAPLNPNYSKKEFLFFLKDLRAKVLVVDPKLKSTASSAAKELGIPILKLFPNEKAGSFILKKNSDFLQNQTQNEPFFFFSKIDSFFMFFISATVIFFYSIAGGLLSIIYLILISLISKK